MNSNLKSLIAVIAITLALACFGYHVYKNWDPPANQVVVSPQQPVTPSARAPHQKDPNPAPGYDWWNARSYTDYSIVEMDQGRQAASALEVCSYHDVNGPLSNRRRDECDEIAAIGKRIQEQRAAEEKRKDDAYDRAHTPEALKAQARRDAVRDAAARQRAAACKADVAKDAFTKSPNCEY
jgi:hypothetical protein